MRVTVDLFNPADGYTAAVTAEQLADLFNVSRTMIYKYRDQGMPQRARNVFDLRDCVRWMIERAARPQSATEETTRAALNNAQRERVELEIARTRGELIPRDEARTVLIGVAQIVASQLDALAPRLAPLASTWSGPADAQTAIGGETMAIRASIALALRDYAAASELAPPAPAPAPASKPKRRAR